MVNLTLFVFEPRAFIFCWLTFDFTSNRVQKKPSNTTHYSARILFRMLISLFGLERSLVSCYISCVLIQSEINFQINWVVKWGASTRLVQIPYEAGKWPPSGRHTLWIILKPIECRDPRSEESIRADRHVRESLNECRSRIAGIQNQNPVRINKWFSTIVKSNKIINQSTFLVSNLSGFGRFLVWRISMTHKWPVWVMGSV